MNIKRIIGHLLPGDEIHQAVYGYELIGDIVILSLGESYYQRGPEMARLILKKCPQVRIVGQKKNGYNGEYRTASLYKLAGYGDFSTVHREFGLRLCVDPDRVYFSPRSGNERNRVTRQIVNGERVLVMFSGIGPLPLMMGLHTSASEIIGVEKNPNAHQLAQKNLRLNARAANVTFYEGDVKEIVPGLEGEFDRIAMPLPFCADRYLSLALQKLKRKGMLHFYDFQHRDDIQNAARKVIAASQIESRQVTTSTITYCGHVGSRKYRVCVDAIIN